MLVHLQCRSAQLILLLELCSSAWSLRWCLSLYSNPFVSRYLHIPSITLHKALWVNLLPDYSLLQKLPEGHPAHEVPSESSWLQSFAHPALRGYTSWELKTIIAGVRDMARGFGTSGATGLHDVVLPHSRQRFKLDPCGNKCTLVSAFIIVFDRKGERLLKFWEGAW